MVLKNWPHIQSNELQDYDNDFHALSETLLKKLTNARHFSGRKKNLMRALPGSVTAVNYSKYLQDTLDASTLQNTALQNAAPYQIYYEVQDLWDHLWIHMNRHFVQLNTQLNTPGLWLSPPPGQMSTQKQINISLIQNSHLSMAQLNITNNIPHIDVKKEDIKPPLYLLCRRDIWLHL